MGLTVRLIRLGREGTSDENRHYRSGRTAWQRSGGVLGPKHDIAALTRSQLDVTSMQAVSETIAGARPDIVIHAAAYTQVDQAERDPETTYMINSLAPVVSRLPQRRRIEAGLYQHGLCFRQEKRRHLCRIGPYESAQCIPQLQAARREIRPGDMPQLYIVGTSWLYGKYAAISSSRYSHLSKAGGAHDGMRLVRLTDVYEGLRRVYRQPDQDGLFRHISRLQPGSLFKV
ncbi:hypothetical protein B7C51_16685 [Paenibacillus larvae subsp. pulvifaciens]|uniref:RmlD-like substrate binding domain-containing protein n=1 Tax=Paenibacillus larvae subsp. pulvifaciens TaxID=1477 RepID=A0A1V0UV77_9BACL|nr:sugar nucleotide-binding protein [Paenibacillus larvae]ARF69094.1 hypothetical protein B7C51_16685 [Paenibacillus larvae subsp. pulvifaciens]